VLTEWMKFITDGAQVILLRVPDELDAFTMFETLNDRGLPTSQADLLKNHLFKKAGTSRLQEAQQKWARMLAVLEVHGIPEITVTYIRHLLITIHGPTTLRDVLRTVKGEIHSEQRAIEFLDKLANSADDYAAMLIPTHANGRPMGRVRESIFGRSMTSCRYSKFVR
jgi:hypothetical protein